MILIHEDKDAGETLASRMMKEARLERRTDMISCPVRLNVEIEPNVSTVRLE